MSINIKRIIILCFVFFTVACGNDSSNNTPPLPSSSGYPVGEVQIDTSSAYPGAESILQSIVVTVEVPPYAAIDVPDPQAGTGTVVGRILNAVTNEPGLVRIYLGEKIEAVQGEGYFISTEQNSSPQGDSNENGYFIINDIAPGTYVLVVWNPVNSEVLVNPDTNGEYWVEIKAGEVFDIGDVRTNIQ
jgi:hypothetical protein